MINITLNGHALDPATAGFLRIDEDALHVLANQGGAGIGREDFAVEVAVVTRKRAPERAERAEPEADAADEQPYAPDSHPRRDEGTTQTARPTGSAGTAELVDGPNRTPLTGRPEKRTQTRVDEAPKKDAKK